MRARVDALDGIRGLALVAVLAYHTGPGSFPGGFLGVEVFFVLSGYLLTSLLLAERKRSGGIDHRRYAVRRVRRLVPAGLVLLVALLLFAPVLAPDDAHRLRDDLLSSLAGITNWRLIADGSSYFDTTGRAPFVRHLWSLGVEIQFCLVCSVMAAWLAGRRRKIAALALGAGAAASAIAMLVLYRAPDPSRAYYGTDTRVGALLVGALLAVVVADGSPQRLTALAHRLFVPALAILGALVLLTDQRSRALYPAGFLVVQAATAVLIVGGQSGGIAAGVLGARPLRWLGQRSYGIYLWHWPLVLLARPGIDVEWHPFFAGVVTIACASVLGALSFRFVERPILAAARIREAWATFRPAVPARARWGAATAAVTIVAAMGALTVRLPTVDPIEESLRAGERVLATQLVPSTTSAPTATDRTAANRPPLVSSRRPIAAPVPLPAPALTNFRPGSISVSAIGDSVMVGGAPALHAKLGSSGYIDARKNRRFSEAAAVARDLRAQGRLGRVVIVHLGNNGPVSNEDIDALMREVSGVQNVLLVTVRVNKGWEGSVNDTLRAAAKRHRTVKIVDWHSYSQGHPDWFYSDGTHLTKAGAEEYAKLLSGSIPPPPKPKPKATPKPTPTPNPIPVPSLPVPPP